MEPQTLGAMIKILSEAIGQRANRDTKEFGLTMQQMAILHFLKTREGIQESSQKDIQEFMKISHPTTVNILRLMKEKGFIETSTSDIDKRMRIVRLTGQEEPFVQEVLHRRDQMESQLVNGLSEQEQTDLRRYLRVLYHNITADSCRKEKAGSPA